MSSVKDLASLTPRLAHVTGVLARHGFGRLLRGNDQWPPPEKVRLAFEELGIVFTKLGQVLSTRRDLIPLPYISELEKLQDNVPPETTDAVREMIVEQLGSPPDELFDDFSPEPIAAATVAQVHTARLPDGRDVVVKVQRPDLEHVISQDLAVLAYLASLLDTLVPVLRPFDPVAMVREFHSSLLQELDFRREARNVARFRKAMDGIPDVWIPDVIAERSADRVITFERSPGKHVSDFLSLHPDKRAEIARRLATVFLRQVFEEGLFHADPHPGNFFVLADGSLCLHDFGIIGELDARVREGLVDLLVGLVRGDSRGVTDSYFELGFVSSDVDRSVVEDQVMALLRDIRSLPLAEVSVGRALESLFRIGSENRIRNPGSLLALSRAFLTLEAVVRDLDPNVNVVEMFREIMPEITKQRYAPERLLSDASETARQMEKFLRDSPAELRKALRRVADGDLGQIMIRDHPNLTRTHNHQMRLLLRTVGAGILTLTGSVLMQGEGWRLVGGGALLLLGLGFLVATSLRSRAEK